MSNEPPERVMHAAAALLDRERAALLRGDLGAVAALAREKEALLVRLVPGPGADPALLETLRTRAERNQTLLDAALHGIRLVSERLAAYRNVRRAMDTYDPQGRKATIPGDVAHRLERRA